MPVNFSIKNVPDETAALFRRRAAANHRSVQGELLALVEAAAQAAPMRKLTVTEIVERARARGFTTPGSSVEFIREDRDDPRR